MLERREGEQPRAHVVGVDAAGERGGTRGQRVLDVVLAVDGELCLVDEHGVMAVLAHDEHAVRALPRGARKLVGGRLAGGKQVAHAQAPSPRDGR